MKLSVKMINVSRDTDNQEKYHIREEATDFTDYTDFFYVKNLHEIFSNLACYLNLQPGTHIPSLTNSSF
jgi:hypothetical protein